jgi:hypothetical protein
VRLAIQARPWPTPRQKSLASVGVSPPTFSFVFTVLFFVIAGLDPAIHAKASLARRFHRRSGRVAFSMDHRHMRSKNAVLRTAYVRW